MEEVPMGASPKIRFTVQEYLALDLASERRFEYIDGDIRLMAGASREHNIVNANIAEVLYDTTADYDRGVKVENYRRIPSLQEYLLVSQDACHVVHYTRQHNGAWTLTETSALASTVDLPAIQCRLPLAEVYAKVDLAP